MVGGALGLLLGNVIWGLVALVVLAVVPWIVLDVVAKRRTATFAAQLPDMLQLLGTTLRSGFSILQGLDTVAQQLSDPIGKEMRHVVAEARLGRPLVDALDEVAQRVRSDDFEWVVTAIGIQREVGGNLAELLDIVADTMNARARLRREAHTLTAEGRIGAIVISILPIAIGFFVYAVNPSYISPLFHTGLRGDPLLRVHRARGGRHRLDAQASSTSRSDMLPLAVIAVFVAATGLGLRGRPQGRRAPRASERRGPASADYDSVLRHARRRT